MDVLRQGGWSRLVLLFSLAVFASMALIACGDDGDADGDTTPTETAEGTAETPESAAAAGAPSTRDGETTPLQIGYLADFSGQLAEFGPAIRTGVELAVQHISDAGGVHGQPVTFVEGDDQTHATAAVEEARR